MEVLLLLGRVLWFCLIEVAMDVWGVMESRLFDYEELLPIELYNGSFISSTTTNQDTGAFFHRVFILGFSVSF